MEFIKLNSVLLHPFSVGSLTVLGSPMGFARKVGSGVKSFFYEPYQGAVLGPQDFVVGLGRGTSHLLANVVRCADAAGI